MLRLRSDDGVEFEVEESVAMLLGTIKLLMEDGCANDVIPLPNVTGRNLAKVLEYCKKHATVQEESPAEKPDEVEKGKTVEEHADVGQKNSASKGKEKMMSEEHAVDREAGSTSDEDSSSVVEEWSVEEELAKWDEAYIDVDTDTLYHLIMAAHYLEVKGLLELTVAKTAKLIKGKSPQEIRETFGIKNDFAPEEEAAILERDGWAFE